jgi:hypothetical protein
MEDHLGARALEPFEALQSSDLVGTTGLDCACVFGQAVETISDLLAADF